MLIGQRLPQTKSNKFTYAGKEERERERDREREGERGEREGERERAGVGVEIWEGEDERGLNTHTNRSLIYSAQYLSLTDIS